MGTYERYKPVYPDFPRYTIYFFDVLDFAVSLKKPHTAMKRKCTFLCEGTAIQVTKCS